MPKQLVTIEKYRGIPVGFWSRVRFLMRLVQDDLMYRGICIFLPNDKCVSGNLRWSYWDISMKAKTQVKRIPIRTSFRNQEQVAAYEGWTEDMLG